MKITR